MYKKNIKPVFEADMEGTNQKNKNPNIINGAIKLDIMSLQAQTRLGREPDVSQNHVWGKIMPLTVDFL